MAKIDEVRINTLEHKVGINKDGLLTGNGLINDIKILNNKLDKISAMQSELSLRLDVLGKDIKNLFSMTEKMKTELKDNINFRTLSKAKNIFIGLAGLLTALGIIGTVIVKIYSVFKE